MQAHIFLRVLAHHLPVTIEKPLRDPGPQLRYGARATRQS